MDAATTSALSAPNNLVLIDLLLLRWVPADRSVAGVRAHERYRGGEASPVPVDGSAVQRPLWALEPLQSQICTWVPAVVDALGSSRQRLDCGL